MSTEQELLEAAVGFMEENGCFDDFENYWRAVNRYYHLIYPAELYWELAEWVYETYKPSITWALENDSIE